MAHFKDPTLDALQQQAAANNQDVARAVARIEVARSQTRITGADFYPSLEFNPSYERLRTTNTGFKGKAQILGNPSSFLGAFGAPSTGTGTGTTAGVVSVPAFTSRGLSTTYSDYRAPLTLRYELDVSGASATTSPAPAPASRPWKLTAARSP